jgi:hypothetical protein
MVVDQPEDANPFTNNGSHMADAAAKAVMEYSGCPA